MTPPTLIVPAGMLFAALALAALTAGCGSASSKEPAAAPTVAFTSEAAPAAGSSVPPAGVPPAQEPSSGVPTVKGYDPQTNMTRLFSALTGPPEIALQAMEQARLNKDVSQVPVLVELLSFLTGQELRSEAGVTLLHLTGQVFGGGVRAWPKWMEWLGKHSFEYPPPDGYVDWKINLLSFIDPRFEVLLQSAEETSRIDLTELVWGGVVVDGIPDLQFPPNIPPSEADFLRPDERVFGASINGEHRAYPLRILNPHEMANDVLGGEPIALAY